MTYPKYKLGYYKFPHSKPYKGFLTCSNHSDVIFGQLPYYWMVHYDLYAYQFNVVKKNNKKWAILNYKSDNYIDRILAFLIIHKLIDYSGHTP
jgi:hypothetical protein